MSDVNLDDDMPPTPNCCEVWPTMAQAFSWFTVRPDRILAPSIRDDAGTFWRVNYCPSCGAPRQDVIAARKGNDQ